MKKSIKHLRVAIVHDSIRYFGGAERVLVALKEIFPLADVYTSIVYWEGLGVFKNQVEKLNPKTSWVQNIYLFRKYPFLYRYLLPFIWHRFDFSSYDLVISSSGAQMSHLIRVAPPAIHVYYCHTPPRHLYGYMTDIKWDSNLLIKYFVLVGNFFLRYFDKKAAHKVNVFIANSHEVADRILKTYGKKATVVYPPLLLSSKNNDSNKSNNFYLSVSRLSRMKHINLIIKACMEAKKDLVIVGTGPEENKLKKLAHNQNVIFLGQVDDDKLMQLYKQCSAVICAAEDEDFGIVPVEAMSFGKPVIAYYSGGYKETIIEGKTGHFFYALDDSALVNALKKLILPESYRKACIQQSKKFTDEEFEKKILNVAEIAFL